jgi:diguanylate cyclase (GGDEF)-like protein
MGDGEAGDGYDTSADVRGSASLPRGPAGAVARIGWLGLACIGTGMAIIASVAAVILLGPLLGLDLDGLSVTMATLLIVSLVVVMPGLAVTLRLVQHLVRGQHRLEDEIRRRAEAELRLRELAARDDLTGLANRRSFVESARRLASLSHRHDRWLALLVLDLAGFKAANDRHGHLVGDSRLRRLSRLLGAEIRQSDIAARLGGDEFAVLLPDADAAQAVLAAERIRRAIEIDPALDQPTASIGGAASRGRRVDLDELLGRGDRALYAAKRQGRNRVVAATTTREGARRPLERVTAG